MPSSERAHHGTLRRASARCSGPGALPVVLALGATVAWAAPARAEPAPGFAAERFYASAPGGGWMVMDDLAMRGALGGAMAFTTGYAHRTLRVSDGATRLDVVSHQAFASLGFAATYERFRLYLNFDSPLVVRGQSGTVGRASYAGPGLDLGVKPDTIADPRLGFDVRLLGGPTGPFRLGLGVQLLVPSGFRSDYVSDGSYRAMGRFLFAGSVGEFVYAGQMGVHVRSLREASVPDGPQGSELLFGVAAGFRTLLDSDRSLALVGGPELYGETAFRSFFGSTTTGLEVLWTGRIEQTGDDGPQLRFKVGVGGGIHPSFGAPEWRSVLGVEVFGRNAAPDHGGRAPSTAP